MELDRKPETLEATEIRSLILERLTGYLARPTDEVSKMAAAFRVSSRSVEETRSSRDLEKASVGLQRLVEILKGQDADQTLQQLKDFALREPALFVGGALLAGFGGGRLLRSSARQEAAVSAIDQARRDYRGQTKAKQEAERPQGEEPRKRKGPGHIGRRR